MKRFDLEILTPERVFYRGECVSLVVPIADGMLGIMANRAPITASIPGGEACLTDPSGEYRLFSLSAGMVDVEQNRVKVLCEYAFWPEEIDEQRAQQALDEARRQLRQKQSRRDHALALRAMTDALGDLRVKKKSING